MSAWYDVDGIDRDELARDLREHTLRVAEGHLQRELREAQNGWLHVSQLNVTQRRLAASQGVAGEWYAFVCGEARVAPVAHADASTEVAAVAAPVLAGACA